MGKIVRLTESELIRLVRKTIQESQANQQIAGSAAVGLAVGGIPGAIVGGLIGYANSGGSGDKVLKMLKYCKSKGMGKQSISLQQASGIADKINGAIAGLGTNEAAIGAAMRSIKYFPDFCAVANTYQQRHGESLANALDGDIDMESDWKKYVWLPLLDMLNRSKAAGQSLGKAGGMGDKIAGAQGLAVNAQKCGWGKDVNGYKASGYKCPKPKTAAKPVGQGTQGTKGVPQKAAVNKPAVSVKPKQTTAKPAQPAQAQVAQPQAGQVQQPQQLPVASAQPAMDELMAQSQARLPQQPLPAQPQQPQRNRPLRNLLNRRQR
jgi:hypothetical protein